MIALLPPSGSVLTERDPSAINPEKKKCGKQGPMPYPHQHSCCSAAYQHSYFTQPLLWSDPLFGDDVELFLFWFFFVFPSKNKTTALIVRPSSLTDVHRCIGYHNPTWHSMTTYRYPVSGRMPVSQSMRCCVLMLWKRSSSSL
jgi:hypothetical protein